MVYLYGLIICFRKKTINLRLIIRSKCFLIISTHILKSELDNVNASDRPSARPYLRIDPCWLHKQLFVAFPWEVTSTGPGGFIICVFIL